MSETVREEMLGYAIHAISDNAKMRFADLKDEIRQLKAARKEWMRAARAACDGRDVALSLLTEIAKQKNSVELGPDYAGDFKYGYDRLIELARRSIPTEEAGGRT